MSFLSVGSLEHFSGSFEHLPRMLPTISLCTFGALKGMHCFLFIAIFIVGVICIDVELMCVLE